MHITKICFSSFCKFINTTIFIFKNVHYITFNFLLGVVLKKTFNIFNSHHAYPFIKWVQNVVNKLLKGCSTSVIIKKNANQNYSDIHLTPIGWLLFKTKTKTKHSRQGCRENGSCVLCRWDYKMLQSLWKTIWQFLKKCQNYHMIYPFHF